MSARKDAERTLVINFGYAIAYRVNPDHVYMRRPWWGTCSKGSLYIVENSSYRDWLYADSAGIFDQPFKHYFIISVDGCLDVLTLSEPVVEWRDTPSGESL